MAYGKRATQGIDTYMDNVASRAVDGNLAWYIHGGSCIHTTDYSSPYDPGWWEVDLGAIYVVLVVNITNRYDCGRCSRELSYIHPNTHIAIFWSFTSFELTTYIDIIDAQYGGVVWRKCP